MINWRRQFLEDVQEKEAEHQLKERWLDELEEDLKALGLQGWRAREKNINKWHRITQRKDLHCPQCQLICTRGSIRVRVTRVFAGYQLQLSFHICQFICELISSYPVYAWKSMQHSETPPVLMLLAVVHVC